MRSPGKGLVSVNHGNAPGAVENPEVTAFVRYSSDLSLSDQSWTHNQCKKVFSRTHISPARKRMKKSVVADPLPEGGGEAAFALTDIT